jgi:hypothetical protein
MGQEAVVKLLLERGAVITVDEEGRTPLGVAVQWGLANVATLLKEWRDNHAVGQ